jgi:hypothetical protein
MKMEDKDKQVFYFIKDLGTKITLQEFIDLETKAAENAIVNQHHLFYIPTIYCFVENFDNDQDGTNWLLTKNVYFSLN